MNKIDLKDVEFHIPVRIDHSNRIENLELIVDYISHHFDTNIVVVENSEKSVLSNHPIVNKIKYHYQFCDNDLFHRTKILNFMAKNSDKPIIVNYDCDILLNVQNYVEAANQIRNNNLDIVYPYDGRFMEVLRDFVPKIQNKFDVSWIKESDCNLCHPNSVGGVVFENREKFLKVGLENEKCVSYGFEDNERFTRFLKLGLRVGRIQGFLIHLLHWRGKNSEPSNEYFYRNMNEYNKVHSMSKQQLEEYVKNWY